MLQICFPKTNNGPSHHSERGPEVYYLFKPSLQTFLGEIKTTVLKVGEGRWHVTHVEGCSL